MSKWITDRKPEHGEGWDGYVWKFEHDKLRRIVRWNNVEFGEPWMPIEPPEPYVMPNRYSVRCRFDVGWSVWDEVEKTSLAINLPSYDAAKRIAEIYREVI